MADVKWAQQCLDFLFPPLCPLCKTIVDHEHALCTNCWPDIDFISDPACLQCGLPLEVGPLDAPMLCLLCTHHEFSFVESRSAFLYTATSKKMILDLKHGHKLSIAPLLAAWMRAAGKDLIRKSDILVPVPLHWTRLIKRGFNQAALLSAAIARADKITHGPRVLARVHRTPPQENLSVQQRANNVKNVFQVTDPHHIHGRSVLLIDDVMTSGATLDAAAKVLLQAGAKCVRTLTAARVRPPKN